MKAQEVYGWYFQMFLYQVPCVGGAEPDEPHGPAQRGASVSASRNSVGTSCVPCPTW